LAHVLVLDGDTRQALPVMQALRSRGHFVTVACESRISVGWFSRYPNQRVLLPSAESSPDAFAEGLLDLVRRGSFDVLMPLFDICAHCVADQKPALEEHTRVALVDRDVFMLARDKANTMRICQENGIPCPRTWFPEEQDLEAIREAVSYPVLVKPRVAHGAMGITRVDRPEDLAGAHERVAADYGPCIIQEFIPHDDVQYKAQFFRDGEGELRAAVVFSKLRYFPIGGGTSSINRTVEREDIVESGRRLLDATNWRGYADLDYIQDPRDGVAKVMEINPRVTGSVKIAFEAGVDFADLMVRFALGEPLPTHRGYRVGVTMRYLPLDVLWFLYSPDRFRAQPSWFRFWGEDLCYQVLSWRDPAPFLAILVAGVRKLLSPKIRAAKLGGIN